MILRTKHPGKKTDEKVSIEEATVVSSKATSKLVRVENY